MSVLFVTYLLNDPISFLCFTKQDQFCTKDGINYSQLSLGFNYKNISCVFLFSLYRWNNAIGVRHPSIWTFIRKLKDEQALHETRVQHMNDGVRPPLRRLKWRRLENRITTLTEQFRNGHRNINDYWRAVRNVIVEFAQFIYLIGQNNVGKK